jgi:CheY-like chemotaxis protein
MSGDREFCLAVGMDGYLSKPFHPEALLATVERWLIKSRRAPYPSRRIDG